MLPPGETSKQPAAEFLRKLGPPLGGAYTLLLSPPPSSNPPVLAKEAAKGGWKGGDLGGCYIRKYYKDRLL